MSHHLVLGAGGVGRSTTVALVALGHTVTLASRSGRVDELPCGTPTPTRSRSSPSTPATRPR